MANFLKFCVACAARKSDLLYQFIELANRILSVQEKTFNANTHLNMNGLFFYFQVLT